jgi:translation initiation factor IF-3
VCDILVLVTVWCQVKFTVDFKGRELKHPEIGIDLLNRIIGTFEGSCTVEEAPKQAGKSMYAVVRPKKK